MLKSYEYQKEMPSVWRKGVYAQECNLIHELLGGVNNCLVLEYAEKKEATNAVQALRRQVRKISKQPVMVTARGCKVYVVKEDMIHNENGEG